MTLTTPAPAQAPPASAPRRRPPWPTASALLVGVVATGFGAGFGGRHATKTGLSPGTVAGLALLALGLVALGLVVRRSWRRLHRWYRLLVVPLVVALLVPVSSLGLAVAYTQVPRAALGDATPADVGLAYRDVAPTTSDGVRLSGWLVPSRNGAAVVLLHGAGSTRSAVLEQARVLAGAGYGVLLPDARGQGRSGGDGMDLGWYGDRDVAAAVDLLVAEPGVDAVGLVGMSMGGEEAIGAAAADPRVRAVVAEGATARTAQDKDAWLPGGVPGAVQRGLDRFTFGLTALLTPAPRPTPLRDAVASADVPFLLVTAGGMPDEARAAAVWRRAAPDRVRTWDVPGAGHTQGLRTDRAGWTARVTGFLDEALLR